MKPAVGEPFAVNNLILFIILLVHQFIFIVFLFVKKNGIWKMDGVCLSWFGVGLNENSTASVQHVIEREDGGGSGVKLVNSCSTICK